MTNSQLINKKTLGLLCVLLIGICLIFPTLDYQNVLAQGDHGRDLYAFNVTAEGDTPFQDYWWVYGPLMPYYYGFFVKILGPTIQSVLIAKSLLVLLSGAFFYLILTTVVSIPVSIIGGLWFLMFKPEFFFTYNHAGGITLCLATLYCSFLYVNNQKNKFLWMGLLTAFVLCLVKINFGIIGLIFVCLTAFLTDWLNKVPFKRKKILIYATGLIFLPLLAGLVYFIFLFGLPEYIIRQCLPYSSTYRPHLLPVSYCINTMLSGIFRNIVSNPINVFIAALIWTCFIKMALSLYRDRSDTRKTIKILSVIFLLCTLYAMNFHEYLSSGVYYRTFWSKPMSYLLIFVFIGLATKSFHSLIRMLVYFGLILILGFSGYGHLKRLQNVKTPHQLLNLERSGIYVGNSPDWIRTVTETTHFLKKNMQKGETFFALPYDVIYYYLMDQKSPTRQIIFFDHIHIYEQQERAIIANLEKNNVNWVVVSNRSSSKEKGLGDLGKSYCPLIGNYLDTHFKPVKQIGNWNAPPGWIHNHAVRILKRK